LTRPDALCHSAERPGVGSASGGPSGRSARSEEGVTMAFVAHAAATTEA